MHEIVVSREGLRGRSFLLGNKRAFSVCLPAASGTSPSQLHPHKWFGAYFYGRKLLEGQVIHALPSGEMLSSRCQTGFTMGLTYGQREYQIQDRLLTERYFVPDDIGALACQLQGECAWLVEPEFDMRASHSGERTTEGYEVIVEGAVAIVSRLLPESRYNDLAELLEPVEGGSPERLYVAVQVVGEGAEIELIASDRRSRRTLFRKDAQRSRFLSEVSGAEAEDHAPLWREHQGVVFVPVCLRANGASTVLYGFGLSKEEALEQLGSLRDCLGPLQKQKSETATSLLERARFETGNDRVDLAYAHVLARLMDALVAQNVRLDVAGVTHVATVILAGNQYFYDSWKRDENIALGFLLTLGQYELARSVVDDTWQLQDERTGRLPQRLRPGEEIKYHSSDGTLWALWRLHQYWCCTGDQALLEAKLPMVRRFFERGIERTVNGLLPSGGTSSSDYLWETWMDTPHTPRHGFPIEIEVLWISCLRAFRPLFAAIDPELEEQMARIEAAAWQSMRSYSIRGTLADSLDQAGQVRDLITPNPYFAFATGLDLGAETESSMLKLGRQQFAGRQGIKTLAPDDWGRVFTPEFLANKRNVRGRTMRSVGKVNYHRGVEWNWLAQFFVQAELKYGDADVAYRRYLARQVSAALETGGIGGISELHDLGGNRGPDFQTWSMSGFLTALHSFAGITIDVPAKRIKIEPQLPHAWPHLEVRKWYGSEPFDLAYRRDQNRRRIEVGFLSGNATDADIEISLVLPGGTRAESIDVRVDGGPQSPGWQTEILAGTHRLRLSTTLPPAAGVCVEYSVTRTSARRQKTA